MAFLHLGAITQDRLSQPYCGRCRAFLIPGIIAAALVGFSAVLAGAWLLLSVVYRPR